MNKTDDTPLISLHRLYKNARKPMPADASALGFIPISAFQYCEAVRAASSFGWYVFPPRDIQLRFDGYQTFVAQDERWKELHHLSFGEDYTSYWNANCPRALIDKSPNFLTSLSEPGIVQIWTGLFIQTAPGWATHYRPLSNINKRRDFTVFEAIVETDEFSPCPLFINISLKATDQEIIINEEFPLFQIQPLPKISFQKSKGDALKIEEAGDPGFDWDGVTTTLRIPGVSKSRKSAGQYGAKDQTVIKKRQP